VQRILQLFKLPQQDYLLSFRSVPGYHHAYLRLVRALSQAITRLIPYQARPRQPLRHPQQRKHLRAQPAQPQQILLQLQSRTACMTIVTVNFCKPLLLLHSARPILPLCRLLLLDYLPTYHNARAIHHSFPLLAPVS
jgi:hypothetical protein